MFLKFREGGGVEGERLQKAKQKERRGEGGRAGAEGVLFQTGAGALTKFEGLHPGGDAGA